jgi:hypothetical protein
MSNTYIKFRNSNIEINSQNRSQIENLINTSLNLSKSDKQIPLRSSMYLPSTNKLVYTESNYNNAEKSEAVMSSSVGFSQSQSRSNSLVASKTNVVDINNPSAKNFRKLFESQNINDSRKNISRKASLLETAKLGQDKNLAVNTNLSKSINPDSFLISQPNFMNSNFLVDENKKTYKRFTQKYFDENERKIEVFKYEKEEMDFKNDIDNSVLSETDKHMLNNIIDDPADFNEEVEEVNFYF